MSAELPPFHRGECEVQKRAGTREESADVGRRSIRDFMPDQHREFFRQQRFVVAGAVDRAGRPWATLLVGPAGFLSSPDPHRLDIDIKPNPCDPLVALLQVGHPIGLLGIDLATRRRNRLNGIVAAASEDGLSVRVSQSFGNCPKYIQSRELRSIEWAANAACRQSDVLDAKARDLIEGADTFFIATAHPDAPGAHNAAYGVDVSHRGGRPGFVRFDAGGGLQVPDYAGNGYFNSLGNLQLNPRAGLLFIDFVEGHLLHVAVEVDIIWSGAALSRTQGAERLLSMRPLQAIWRERALRIDSGPPALSRYLPDPAYWQGK